MPPYEVTTIRTSEHDKHMPRWSNAARKAIILSNDAARLKEEPTFSKNDLKILTDDQLITVGMMSKKPLAGTQQPIAKKLDLVTPWGKSHLNKTFKTLDASSTHNKTSFRPQIKQRPRPAALNCEKKLERSNHLF